MNPALKLTKTLGTVVATCKADRAAVCYLFQQGADPAHPEIWAAPVIESKARHAMPGFTIGQKAYCRISIVRRGTGQGEWSGVMDVTVR